jgi:hypothetical protein
MHKVFVTLIILALSTTVAFQSQAQRRGQTSANVKAQASSNVSNIRILGLDINSNINDFKLKAKKNGLVLKEDHGNKYLFEGKFAGYNNCVYYVNVTPESKTIIDVLIKFEDLRNNWSRCNSAYETLKEQLTNKYKKFCDIEDSPKNLLGFYTLRVESDDAKIRLNFLDDLKESCVEIIYTNKLARKIKETNNSYSEDL